MNLTANEIIVLRYLYPDKNTCVPPDGMKSSLYKKISMDLDRKDIVDYDDSCYDGTDIELTVYGRGVYEEIEKDMKRILRHILNEKDLSLDEYECIKHTKITGHFENTFGIDGWEFQKIWKSCAQKGYLKAHPDANTLIVTRAGECLVDEVEDEVGIRYAKANANEDEDGEIEELKNKLKKANSQIKSLKEKTTAHGDTTSPIHIAKGRTTDVIRLLWSMCKSNYFVDEDGKLLDNKVVMKHASSFFNYEGLKTYNSQMTNDKTRKSQAYKTTINELEEVWTDPKSLDELRIELQSYIGL